MATFNIRNYIPMEELEKYHGRTGHLSSMTSAHLRQKASDTFSVLEKEKIMGKRQDGGRLGLAAVAHRIWEMRADGRITDEDLECKFFNTD